jgi:hypothetical protein
MSPGKREGSAEEDAVANFREYLRIPSVQPDVNYGMIYKKAVVYVMWLDVSLKMEGKMVIIFLDCNIFGC